MEYNTQSLWCTSYSVSCEPNEVIRIDAEFIMKIPTSANADIIKKALGNIATMLNSGEINMVKAGNAPRCFYCGVLSDKGDTVCQHCGAPL